MSKRIGLVLFALLAISVVAWAQVLDSVDPSAPDASRIISPPAMSSFAINGYGIQDFTAAVTAPQAFHPANDGLGYIPWFDGYISPQAGDTFLGFHAAVDLPTGALLSSVTALAYDNSASGSVGIRLNYRECAVGSICDSTTLVEEETGETEGPGYTMLTSSNADGVTWKNYDLSTDTLNYGYLEAYFTQATSQLRIGPIVIWYRRQISPAPAVQTFPDVAPGFWAFQEIESLAASGITQGFPDGTFRPTDPVTRAQMATFLARALGLHWPG